MAEEFSCAKEVFQEVEEALSENLFRLCALGEAPKGEHGTAGDALTRTANAQPALLAHGIAALRALGHAGGLEAWEQLLPPLPLIPHPRPQGPRAPTSPPA